MTTTNAERLIQRLATDTELAEQFRTTPEEVLDEYGLTDEEREALASGTREELSDTSGVSTGRSPSWYTGP